MRHKRDSKRRWKARMKLGRWIPWLVIMQHRLAVAGPWERAISIDCVRRPT